MSDGKCDDNATGAARVCGDEGHMSKDCTSFGGDLGVEVYPGRSGRSAICSKTTQVLQEAAEAAVDLLLALNASIRVSWKKNNRVLKMAADLLPVLTEARNSIREETVRALEVARPKMDPEHKESHSSRDPANVARQEEDSAEVTFQQLKLHPLLLENVRKCGYTEPTPTQKRASPQLLAGRDILVCAEPASGKTTSFLLPIINQLLNDPDSLTPPGIIPAKPSALILVSTRELAVQIGNLANMYSAGSRIKTQVLYGGVGEGVKLMTGCHILIATTGKLKQFLGDGIMGLSNVSYFILDEADSFLEDGFISDVKDIVAKLPEKGDRISAMFCSISLNEIETATIQILNNHLVLSVGDVESACQNIPQQILQMEWCEKPGKALELVLDVREATNVVIFCSNKKDAAFLRNSAFGLFCISSIGFHGDLLESEKEQALKEFSVGNPNVLVVTSLEARGLDFPKVGLIVNHDLPNNIGEYHRRIWLAGRMGHVGRAVSFYDENQDKELKSSLVSALKRAGQPVPEFLGGGSNEQGGLEEGACAQGPG